MEEVKIIKNTTNNMFFSGAVHMEEVRTSKNSIHNISLKDGDITFVRTGDGKTHMYEFKGDKLTLVPETQPSSEDGTER